MAGAAAYIAALIQREGGYVNDDADSGGETTFGITVDVARAYGYLGKMRDLPIATAQAIYMKRYWTRPHFDQIDVVDPTLAAKMLDIGTNMGPTVAATFLQRALNSLNDGASRFSDLEPDGDVGPMTIQALRAFIAQRGDEGRAVLLMMVRSQQSVRYMEIAEGKPSQERFSWGWQRSRALL